MHQHPRPPPVTASPASSQRTNPTRTNNPREELPPPRPSMDRSSPTHAAASDVEHATALPPTPRAPPDGREPIAKLNQVVQNFYTKAALLILAHRVTLAPAMSKETGEKRVNKWFNVEVDETNDLLDALRLWKSSHIHDQRPPPMIIEVYLDATSPGHQSLILQDERGHQWGVEDAIRSYVESHGDGGPMPSSPRIILERWRCHLGPATRELPPDLAAILPRVYKNSIVLFRSLFAYLKLLPAWELTRKRHLASSQRPPKLQYRIYEEGHPPEPHPAGFDALELALDDGRTQVTQHYAFDPIDSPAGPYAVEVTFRQRCDFRWEGRESVYSSKFIGQDEDLFRPSLDRYRPDEDFRRPDAADSSAAAPPRRPNLMELAAQSQAYGSMSTYHHTDARVSSSPMSALRAAREYNLRSPTDDSPPNKALPDARGSSESRGPGRGDAAPSAVRRTSVSIMPFKTPSLSASPLQLEPLAAPPHRPPVGRATALEALADARRPSGAAATVAAAAGPALRPSPGPLPEAASLSSSPRPSGRYSSSFGHRRARLSMGGGSKGEDDNSSGKASVASSTQPGSAMMAAGDNSSGSLHTDDDNIADFLKLLDHTWDLQSFQIANDASTDATTRRAAPGLSQYQRLRDTNSALTESMSSSLQLPRSPGAAARLANIGTTAGTSASSSSPAERMSPRTPHTPAVPSRLSANSIVEYTTGELSPEPPQQDNAAPHVRRGGAAAAAGPPRPGSTVAIDIPTSPRFHPSYRRSSSAVHREQRLHDEDRNETVPFATRISLSVGTRDGRAAVPRTELLNAADQASKPSAAHAAQARLSGGADMARQKSSDSQNSNEDESPRSPLRFRPRLSSETRRRTHGSSTSLAGAASSGSVGSNVRDSRYSFTRSGPTDDDEELLLFAMSDFGSGQPRRSIDETPSRRPGRPPSTGEAARRPKDRTWS